jgi:hypothetical protein
MSEEELQKRDRENVKKAWSFQILISRVKGCFLEVLNFLNKTQIARRMMHIYHFGKLFRD